MLSTNVNGKIRSTLYLYLKVLYNINRNVRLYFTPNDSIVIDNNDKIITGINNFNSPTVLNVSRETFKFRVLPT